MENRQAIDHLKDHEDQALKLAKGIVGILEIAQADRNNSEVDWGTVGSMAHVREILAEAYETAKSHA